VPEEHVVLQLVNHLRGDSQRIDDDALGLELDEVETSERSRIVVLKPSLDAQVLAFEIESEVRHVVVGQRLTVEF
jgi:hypothetical protein